MKEPSNEVRVAMNGPSLDHDELISNAAVWNAADRKRASSAGETRAEIKEFLEETGMNGKALSWLRQILKINDKDDGQSKAMDVIMSLEKGLPMIRAHVAGQGTPDMLAPPKADVVEPTDDAAFFAEKPPEFVDDADDYEASLAEVPEAAE